MTIEWTPEAIEAAHKELTIYDDRSANDDMRAALDAAVQAQGMLDRVSEAIEQGRILGRREALEEAANILETNAYACNDLVSEILRANAAAIRTLKEKQG